MSNKNKIFIGKIVLMLINVIPVVLWLLVQPLGTRVGSLNQILTSLGQVFGLLGMSLFATAIILSARLKVLEDYFNGLNRIYIKHHLIGGVSFCLILFHPLWLTVKYAVFSSQAAAIFLLPTLNNPAQSLGSLALAIMMVLLIVTFYFSLKYQVWKMSHKFLGLAFIIAFLHMILIPSDVSRYGVLAFYMSMLSGLTIVVYIHHSWLPQFGRSVYEYTVIEVRKLAPKIMEVVMRPNGDKLSFKAGQYAFFSFKQKGLPQEEHPFSFTSDPKEMSLSIVIKALGDFTTSCLNELKVGAGVKIEGPFGEFTDKGEKQIWIAGGVGITPYLSRAKSLGGQKRVDLFWSVVDEAEIFYQEELKKVEAENKDFIFHPHMSKYNGYLTAELIKNKIGDLQDKEIFVCGPPAMMKALKQQFKGMAINDKNIHSEEFSL